MNLLPSLRRLRKQHATVHASLVFGLSLLTALPPARAGDILRPSAAAGGSGGGTSPAVVAPGVDPVATAQALALGRAAAGDILARGSEAYQSLKAMQDAARALAISGPNNLGINPNNPAMQLDDVPNGLGMGGLQVDPAVATNAALWSGANAPTQITADGHTTVTVEQTAQQALLNWETFNIGRQTTLKFDQSAGGANAGQWIAFNFVNDSSGAPSQILGSIQAQGQVYIINQNGIIFGGSSHVNTHTLVASSLPINSNLVSQGLLNNPDAQFLFTALALPQGGDGTPAYNPPAPPVGGRIGDVTVQAGALIEAPTSDSNVGGRVMLVGPNVTNNGTIATPDGQAILAAGLQVGVIAHSSTDASLRGLDVYVGAVVDPASLIPPYAGTATNNGVIEAPRGNTTITGREVVHNGAINSSTSVALNGRVDLLASYGARSNTDAGTKAKTPFLFSASGHVTLGAGSVTQILPEWGSTEKITGTELALRSQVNIQGLTARFGAGSTLLAPNALVSVKAGVWDYYTQGTVPESYFVYSDGQIYLDAGAVISVAGSTDVSVPVTQNLITLELRAAELADSPLQRNGVLRGQTITVDIRETGVYNGKTWVGTPLADVSGYLGLIERTVGQLTVAGGSVSLHSGGSVVMQDGSKVDTSAGWINYTGGEVQTTRVITGGHIIDISQATPNLVYDGIYTPSTTLRDLTWAVSTSFVQNIAPGVSYQDPGSLHGAAGGKLSITAAAVALDGSLIGRTVQGAGQRAAGPDLAQLSLVFESQRSQGPDYLHYSPTPPTITFSSGVVQTAAAAFALDGAGRPLALSAERLADVYLSPELLISSGFGRLRVENGDGRIIVPSDVSLTAALRGEISLIGTNLDIFGSLTAPGGSINLTALNIGLGQRSDLIKASTQAVEPPPNAGRGLLRLGATTRLSTAGTLMDDRGSVQGFWLPAYASEGGSITLTGYDVELPSGSVIDVSGGVRLSEGGVPAFGNAGTITLRAGLDNEIRYVDGGRFTQFAATLLGYSGAEGGTLAVQAPLLQVGGVALHTSTLMLDAEFFTQGGFSHHELTGLGAQVAGQVLPAVYVAAGTVIAPVADSLVLAEGPSLATTILRLPVGLRSTMSLTLQSSGIVAVDGLKMRGDIVLEAGSLITTDPGATVALHGHTVAVLGSISTPGGHIDIRGDSDSGPLFSNYTEALATVYIGPASVLSAVGTRVLVPDDHGRRIGQVLDGGSISIGGNIIAAAGAVLDVSGASGVLDFDLPSTHPLANYLIPANSGLTAPVYTISTVPVTVDSNGGSITLAGAQVLASDATLRGFAGGSTALGGTLSVSSERFYVANSPQPLLDTNLVITQSGPVIRTLFPADATAIGQALLGAGGAPLISRGYFAADSFNSSGMDSLILGGKVEFQGATSITTRGSVQLGRVGLLFADAAVSIQAGALSLGAEFVPPQLPEDAAKQVPFTGVPPVTGGGSLSITAGHVELGSLALQNIGSASITAVNGDIVGNGVLSIAGHVTLTAGQIYAPTATSFTVAAYDYFDGGSARTGSITTRLSGGARQLPLSAGSTLGLYATTIDHGGVLRAPFGTIRLGWDGTGTAPRELLTGSTLPFPVTTQLTLAAGSVTSVSAIDPITGQGVIIPYGASLDGTLWLDPHGVDITASGPPEKQVLLQAVNIDTQAGSSVDLRGGGDLMAWRWVQGNGGTRDILDTDGSFAILPGYLSSYVLEAPFNNTVVSALNNANPILAAGAGYVNDTLKIGDRIYLAGSANLAAGVYTLLPARYALLPGAVLVTPKSMEPALGLREVAGNISLVSGYRFNDLNTTRVLPTLASRYEVVGQGVIHARSDYDLFYASTFFPQAAARLSLPVSRLPQDSGYLLLQATQSMALNASVLSTSLSATGRGGSIDITAPLAILITADGSGGGAGTMALSAQALGAFDAESLLIGGRRTRENGVVNVTTQSTSITVSSGASLVTRDVTLATQGALTVATGAGVTSAGTASAADAFNVVGNGALLRVAQSTAAAITRSGVTTAAGPALTVAAGAQISGASVIFDSTSAITLDATASISGGRYTVSSGHISLLLDSPGALQPAPGLVVTGSFLAALRDASALSLQSYSSLDVYGTGVFGGADLMELSLSAAQIRGFNQAGGEVRFVAGDILLANPSNGTTVGLAAPATGSLAFEAATVRLGTGQVAMDQFSTVSITASHGLTGQGTGGLTVQNALTITTPQISGAAGAVRTLVSGGDLSLLSSAAVAAPTAGGLGSALGITGANVQVGTVLRLPSGSLSIRSTTGHLDITSTLDVSGTAQGIYDVTRYTDAGEIILTADAGNVVIGGQGIVNVAAQPGGGNAGLLSIGVAAGSFINNGSLIASGGIGGRHGSFVLDTAALPTLSTLAAALSAASFTQSQSIRVRGGDVLVDGSSQAATFRLSADQGSISVTGAVNASGVTGGSIYLSANGSVTLGNGALLTVAAQDFNSAGKGGDITLEAGATRNGVAGTGAVDIQSGSTLNLSVASKVAGGETTAGSSAYQGRFSGTLHIRAPQNSTFNDLLVNPLNGNIIGASSILVEGFRVYDLTASGGVISTATQTSIRTNSQSFLGTAGTTTANYTNMMSRLLANNAGLTDLLVLAPGAEFVNLTGGLTLGAANSNTSADWDLSGFRFGAKSAPGVLTLRAAGSVTLFNALSDSFTPTLANTDPTWLWLARSTTNNALLPVNTQSWSYRIIAGADLAAADFRQVQALSSLAPGAGSVIIGKNGANMTATGGDNALTSAVIGATLSTGGRGLFQVVRTGSGGIDVIAGRSVQLANQFATIYTAGTRVTDPTLGATFQLPGLSQALGTGNLGAVQQNFPALYGMAGGNVLVQAGGNIERTGASSSRELPNNWLYRRGNVADGRFAVTGFSSSIGSTTWWVDFSNFFQGVGALSGGNVTLNAAGNVVNVDAVAPTNGRVTAGNSNNPLAVNQTLLEIGGGDVNVRAGGNIDAGVYYVERGRGTLWAGGQITTNATRSPGLLNTATGANTVFNSNTWLPTTLFVGKGGFDLTARGDLLLGPVANVFLLPQGVNNTYWLKTYFSTYAPDSYVNASSLGGTVTLRQGAYLLGAVRPLLEAWISSQQIKSSISSAFSQPWLRLAENQVTPFTTLISLLPPTLRATAYSGGINLAGNLTLFPSANGTLELLARGSINGLNPLGQDAAVGSPVAWGAASINVSDAQPSSIPGVFNPYAYQQVPTIGTNSVRASATLTALDFLNFIDILFDESGATLGSQALLKDRQARHSAGLLHRNDASPVRIYASGGDFSGVTLYTPKAAHLLASRDISDVALYLQNVSASDVSIVAAGRDIVAYNGSTSQRTAAAAAGNIMVRTTSLGTSAPLAGDIQINGPGTLQVWAGRNLDLGAGGRNEATGLGLGITSVGNARNPYLGFDGADIIAGAGVGFAAGLASSSLNFTGFISTFVLGPDGPAWLAEVGGASLTPAAFAALPPEEQRRLALEIFYLVLRDAGRTVNRVGSSGYDSGYAAIESLFPGTTWQGGISTQFRDIRTKNGGSIHLFAPGGSLSLAASVPAGTTPGIVTEAGGDIAIFTKDSVNLGIARIFTLKGGDIVVWSSDGDIAAGSSSKTVQAAPPTRVLIDPQSADVTADLAGLATGGGIGVLASVKGIAPGSVDLIAPKGVVDAGDAGIRATGNLNIAATQVLNAGNISAGGTSSGTPVASVSAPNMGAVSSAATAGAATSGAATSAQQAAQGQQPVAQQQVPSIITVEVLGYGGEDDEDEEQRRKRQRQAAQQGGAE